MSHSPTNSDEEAKEYLEGWSATYELVRQGKSWSGNERHVCFLNTGDGAFTEEADGDAIIGAHLVGESEACR